MDVIDFESILGKIVDQIQPKERLGGTNPINSDERLALTLRFLAFTYTGEIYFKKNIVIFISMTFFTFE